MSIAKFKFTESTNCLSVEKGKELIDYKFYGLSDYMELTPYEFLKMLIADTKTMAKENNITTYIYNFIQE